MTPAVPLLENLSESSELHIHTKTWTWMFMKFWFILAKSSEPPKYPSTGKWIDKLWSRQQQNNTEKKKWRTDTQNNIIDLKSILLKQRNQKKIKTHFMIPFFIKHFQSPNLIYKHRRNCDSVSWELEKGIDWKGHREIFHDYGNTVSWLWTLSHMNIYLKVPQTVIKMGT